MPQKGMYVAGVAVCGGGPETGRAVGMQELRGTNNLSCECPNVLNVLIAQRGVTRGS